MSRNGIFHQYNVYIDGNLVATKVTNKEAAELSGCDMRLINKYASKGYNHTKDGKVFRFEIMATTTAKGRPRSVKSVTKDTPSQMPAEWLEEWDKWRKLALKALHNPAAMRRYREGKVS